MFESMIITLGVFFSSSLIANEFKFGEADFFEIEDEAPTIVPQVDF